MTFVASTSPSPICAKSKEVMRNGAASPIRSSNPPVEASTSGERGGHQGRRSGAARTGKGTGRCANTESISVLLCPLFHAVSKVSSWKPSECDIIPKRISEHGRARSSKWAAKTMGSLTVTMALSTGRHSSTSFWPISVLTLSTPAFAKILGANRHPTSQHGYEAQPEVKQIWLD